MGTHSSGIGSGSLKPLPKRLPKFAEKLFRRCSLRLKLLEIRRKPAPETIFRRHFNKDKKLLHSCCSSLSVSEKHAFPLEACPLNTGKILKDLASENGSEKTIRPGNLLPGPDLA